MTGVTSSHDSPLRSWLWASAVFTLSGALMFGISHPQLASVTGLPTEVPAIYRALTVLMMLLFGSAYGWMATRKVIDRTLVAFGAIAKLAAFATLTTLWMASEITTRTWTLIGADLVFACAFLWCLRTTASTPSSARSIA